MSLQSKKSVCGPRFEKRTSGTYIDNCHRTCVLDGYYLFTDISAFTTLARYGSEIRLYK